MLIGALLVAACGSDEEPQATPTQEASSATPTVPTQPAVLPTVDPNISLVAYHSDDLGYSIGYPQGWEFDVEPGFAEYFLWYAEDGRPIAQLAVSCNPTALTVEELIAVDESVAASFAGIDPGSVTDIEIAGTTGRQLRYTVSIETLVVEQVAAYAPGDECGWRLGLASYGPNTLTPYTPLFNRIVASFQPD